MKSLARAIFALSLPFVALAAAPTSSLAQDRPIDLLPPELRSEVNDSISNVLNALHVFSSSDTVSSGSFTFDGDGEPDTDLDVMKISADLKFQEDDNQALVPFITGLVGHAKLTGEITPLNGVGQNDFISFETTSFGLGAGADWNVFDNLHFVPKMTFVYSQSTNEYDYNNEESQALLQLFDRDLFNWDVDTMTYLPSTQVYYSLPIGDVKIEPSVQFSYVAVDSTWTNSHLIDVSTASEILLTKLRATTPLRVSVSDLPLELEVYGARHDIYGDALEAFGFHSYHEIGGALYINDTRDCFPLFSKIGIGSSYAWNSDFDGWRIGILGEI